MLDRPDANNCSTFPRISLDDAIALDDAAKIGCAYIGVDSVAYRCLIPETHIWLARAEDEYPVELCREWEFSSFLEAQGQLILNAQTAPKGGTYDKHDFKVSFANGSTYSGRYDVSRGDTGKLWKHIYDFARWLAVESVDLPHIQESERTYARALVSEYNLHQHAIPALPGSPVIRDYSKTPLQRDEPPLSRMLWGLEAVPNDFPMS